MNAAFVQFAPAYLDTAGNLAHMESLVTAIDADLIVLPELCTSGYFFRSTDDAHTAAEPIPEGPSVRRMRTWSTERDATIVAGLAEEADGTLYNSAVVVHPTGTVDTYRKVHLYYEETQHFAPGDLGFPVFSCRTRDGQAYKLGVMVCFDWYFPEAARSLALNGADVIAHPSNLVLPYCPDAMPVRARENHVFTVTCNRHGSETSGDESLTFIGRSIVCDPTGSVLAEGATTDDDTQVVSFNPHDARDRHINRYNDVLGDRRPDVYS